METMVGALARELAVGKEVRSSEGLVDQLWEGLSAPASRDDLIEEIERHETILKDVGAWIGEQAPGSENFGLLTKVFKLIRNLCAFSRTLQSRATLVGLHLHVAAFLSHQPASPEALPSCRMAIQLLGNLGTMNDEGQERIWREIIDGRPLSSLIFAMKDEKAISDWALVLHSLICNSPERRRSMVSKANQNILQLFLQSSLTTHADASATSFEMGFLLFQGLFENALFPEMVELFFSMDEGTLFPPELKALLKLLDAKIFKELQKAEGLELDALLSSWLNERLLGTLVRLFNKLDFTLLVERSMASGEDHETESLLVLLHIFVELSRKSHPGLTSLLFQLGLIRSAIHLLDSSRGLKPITLKANQTLDDEVRAALFGFKVHLVKILGNLAHRNRAIQDEIRLLEGVPLILESCNIDDSNPYLKEWAIVAIRNLCENNLENQRLIQQMQPQGPVSTPVLDELGVQLELTEDGKGLRPKKI